MKTIIHLNKYPVKLLSDSLISYYGDLYVYEFVYRCTFSIFGKTFTWYKQKVIRPKMYPLLACEKQVDRLIDTQVKVIKASFDKSKI